MHFNGRKIIYYNYSHWNFFEIAVEYDADFTPYSELMWYLTRSSGSTFRRMSRACFAL